MVKPAAGESEAEATADAARNVERARQSPQKTQDFHSVRLVREASTPFSLPLSISRE
jgi:hypothetical protein